MLPLASGEGTCNSNVAQFSLRNKTDASKFADGEWCSCGRNRISRVHDRPTGQNRTSNFGFIHPAKAGLYGNPFPTRVFRLKRKSSSIRVNS